MKRNIIILWIVFAVCVITTVVLWFVVNNDNVEYEEVKVTVVSATTEQIRNRKTGSTTTFYKVKVRYNGETYDLENPHNVYMYPEGKSVTAYLANNRLFANVEGVQTSTPIATVYFIFLFGSFIMLFVASMYTSKVCQKNKETSEEIEE